MAAAAQDGTSPIRNYVVLEKKTDDEGDYFVVVHKVAARNPTNAMRAAFRELAKTREGVGDHVDTTLVVVPETQWKPTPVRARVLNRVTVSIG